MSKSYMSTACLALGGLCVGLGISCIVISQRHGVYTVPSLGRKLTREEYNKQLRDEYLIEQTGYCWENPEKKDLSKGPVSPYKVYTFGSNKYDAIGSYTNCNESIVGEIAKDTCSEQLVIVVTKFHDDTSEIQQVIGFKDH